MNNSSNDDSNHSENLTCVWNVLTCRCEFSVTRCVEYVNIVVWIATLQYCLKFMICVGPADRHLWPCWIWQDSIASGHLGPAASHIGSSYKGWPLCVCQSGAVGTECNSERKHSFWGKFWPKEVKCSCCESVSHAHISHTVFYLLIDAWICQ